MTEIGEDGLQNTENIQEALDLMQSKRDLLRINLISGLDENIQESHKQSKGKKNKDKKNVNLGKKVFEFWE